MKNYLRIGLSSVLFSCKDAFCLLRGRYLAVWIFMVCTCIYTYKTWYCSYELLNIITILFVVFIVSSGCWAFIMKPKLFSRFPSAGPFWPLPPQLQFCPQSGKYRDMEHDCCHQLARLLPSGDSPFDWERKEWTRRTACQAEAWSALQ